MRSKAGMCIATVFLSVFLLFGCGGGRKTETGAEGTGGSAHAQASEESGKPLRESAAVVLVPEASGSEVFENEYAKVDVSNTSRGYVMAAYLGSTEKVKIQITGPDGADYTYLMKTDGSFQTFPLTAGNGGYEVKVLECVGGDSYAIAMSQHFEVSLENEFFPFLYPNEYCEFTSDSAAVKKGEELAGQTYSDLEVVENIYDWVISNVAYDEEKAASVQYGYLPDVDATLETKKGICFDYAALMACMLRSQDIPTKLEVGYSGEAYHAWISTYLEEAGWVADIIEFDGHSWSLMDPTLAANNDAGSVKKYVGDGSNYVVKYSY